LEDHRRRAFARKMKAWIGKDPDGR
jgi:hypothetical protein